VSKSDSVSGTRAPKESFGELRSEEEDEAKAAEVAGAGKVTNEIDV
jgi:hypothetical protein